MSNVEQFIKEQLRWNKDHKRDDEIRHDEIRKMIIDEFIKVNAKLNPMAENFAATKKLGKWTLVVLSFVALILTIIGGIKNNLLK